MTLFNSFDDAEFDDKEVATESDPIEELAQEDEQLDEELDEADQRINLAGYYRILVRGGIFKDGSEEAHIVDAEVRQFARQRMAELLNLRSAPKPKVELPFSDTQIAALQQWANRIIEKQNSLSPQLSSPRAPQLPAAVPQSTPVPAITSLAPPQNVRKETPKRKPKPVAPKPVVAKKEQPVASGLMTEQEQESVPDGQLFEVDGKQYKWIVNGDGRRLKVRQTARPIVGRGHGMPMPSAQAMAGLSVAKAHEDLATTPAATSERIQAAAALSIIKQD